MVEIDGEKFFTTQEVAEKLGITSSRVSQLRKQGLIDYHQITTKKFLYSEKHILEYIKGSKTENDSNVLLLAAQTKKELVEQLEKMVSGEEDNFDRLIKEIETQSYESWKEEYKKLVPKPSSIPEETLKEEYIKYFRYSFWLKEEKVKQ